MEDLENRNRNNVRMLGLKDDMEETGRVMQNLGDDSLSRTWSEWQ